MSKTQAKTKTAKAKTETTEETAKPKMARLELCDWKEGIPASMVQSKSGYSMKVRPKAIKTEDDIAAENNLDPDD